MTDLNLNQLSDEDFKDISSEEYRVYHFANHQVYRVNNPVKIYIKRKPEGDSHRIVDAQGESHYITAGWMAFRFKNKTDEKFQF